MINQTLYIFSDGLGNTVVSPIPPINTKYELSNRLIAKEGMDLINAEGIRVKCIDTDTPENWLEVEEIPKEEGDIVWV